MHDVGCNREHVHCSVDVSCAALWSEGAGYIGIVIIMREVERRLAPLL